MKTLTVATRASDLAIFQTNTVIAKLLKIAPNLKIKIAEVTTSGDSDTRTALWNLKNTGFFTSQLEDALLEGSADLAVHSFKDMPTKENLLLQITAAFDRNYPADCLVARKKIKSLDELPANACVGTSSLRRASQLLFKRADLKILPIRGNIQTRLTKLDQGQYDAVIIASAALERLCMTDSISITFSPDDFIPAPAQGAIAVQTRSDDNETNQLVSQIDDIQTRIICLAERQILKITKCGCHAPVGAFAKIRENDIIIDAFIADCHAEIMIRKQITGPIDQHLILAEKLANEILNAGGRKILDDLESDNN